MALSDIAIRNAKATTKPYKLSDSGGLFLLIATTGGKLWRYSYRFDGKIVIEVSKGEQMIGFFKQWAANAAEYKQLQQELTAVLARSGVKFMQLHPKVTNFLVIVGREEGADEAVAKLDKMMVTIADTFPNLNQEQANKQLIHTIDEINRLAKSH